MTTFLLGMFLGVGIGLAVAMILRRPHAEVTDTDEALIVKFLQAYGPSAVSSMQVHMEDLTRGECDWHGYSEKRIHRAMKRLEAAGAVTSAPDDIWGRLYSLAAPNALIQQD